MARRLTEWGGYRYLIAMVRACFSCLCLLTLSAQLAAVEWGGGGNSEGISELPGGKVSYRHFTSDDTSVLQATKGRNVVLLTREGEYPQEVIDPFVYDLDKIHDYYEDIAGEPKPHWFMDGKTTIAEVGDTGAFVSSAGRRYQSAAKGFSGHTGIEISADSFYRTVSNHSAGRGMGNIPYWEMGRNFWFGGDYDVGWESGVAGVGEAYALSMQTIAARQAGVKPDPCLLEVEGEIYRTLDKYIKDPQVTFQNTLESGKDSFGREGRAHWLLAGMITRLHRDHGGDAFLRRFLAEIRDTGGANGLQATVDHLAVAASRASGRDLTRMMREEWKLPVSDWAVGAARGYGGAGAGVVINQPINKQGLGALGGGDLSPPEAESPHHDAVEVAVGAAAGVVQSVSSGLNNAWADDSQPAECGWSVEWASVDEE